MDMIQKMLNVEELNYATNLNENGLKEKIESLFKQSTLRLAGRLTSENEFTIYDNWNVVGWSVPSLRRKAVYLYGKIKTGEKGTRVKLKIKPNSFLPIFALLSTLIGLTITLAVVANPGNNFFLFLGVVFITLGIIYYVLSIFLKNRLRNKIVQHLDLNKV